MAQTLQSVSQALRALTILRSHEAIGVTELARELGLGASTVHRILATLEEHDFVERTTGRRYRAGPAMRLSPDAAAIEHCIEMSSGVMDSLRDASQETAHISVLDGTRSKFVAARESPHMMRVTSRVGLTIHAHTSAAGRALLAQLPRERLLELYPHEHLSKVTDRSGGSRQELFDELDAINKRGYGRNFGESEVGLAALAVVIRRPAGRPLCCLTLTGPIARFDPTGTGGVSQRELEFIDMLREHGTRLETMLQY